MEKTIKELKKRMEIAYGKCELLREDLGKEVQKVCDFCISITYCEGDGFMILNEDTSETILFDALIGKSKENKLTKAQNEK